MRWVCIQVQRGCDQAVKRSNSPTHSIGFETTIRTSGEVTYHKVIAMVVSRCTEVTSVPKGKKHQPLYGWECLTDVKLNH